MRYHVLDTRFACPVHVFLDVDPQSEKDFPDLAVTCVTLEHMTGPGPAGAYLGPAEAVGQDPWRPDRFREFRSDAAARAAGFVVVEPRFVGSTWAAYDRVFRFGGRTVRSH